MYTAVFPDKQTPPDDAALARVLGRAKRHWDDLAAHASTASPTATAEWKYYGKRNGWVFVVRGKRHALMYLIPHEKHFTVSFAYRGKAVQAAAQSDLPAHVIEMIHQSPKYPEGRAVRLLVKSATDVKIAKRLLTIKVEN